jgi:hypothetical protein
MVSPVPIGDVLLLMMIGVMPFRFAAIEWVAARMLRRSARRPSFGGVHRGRIHPGITSSYRVVGRMPSARPRGRLRGGSDVHDPRWVATVRRSRRCQCVVPRAAARPPSR